ncbi:MAG: ATP-binding cassette domain-containing protein [Vicinamibacterales bacterium]
MHAVLRAGRSDAHRSRADGLRDAVVGIADAHGASIRNILGGFLFSGDDVYKKAGVLSGGERTRLAVARMLLRPSNTLLLDEPTNHLDLDSKEVLLDALVDYGGTLIFVSHDRYFVERLATKIVEVGGGEVARLSGHLHRVPVEQGAPGAQRGSRHRPRRAATTRDRRRRRRPTSDQPPPAPAAGAAQPATRIVNAIAAEREEARARYQALAVAHHRARGANRRTRSRDQDGSRRAMSAPGFYDDPRRRQADPRPSPGADVGSGRSDHAVGDAAGRGGDLKPHWPLSRSDRSAGRISLLPCSIC